MARASSKAHDTNVRECGGKTQLPKFWGEPNLREKLGNCTAAKGRHLWLKPSPVHLARGMRGM